MMPGTAHITPDDTRALISIKVGACAQPIDLVDQAVNRAAGVIACLRVLLCEHADDAVEILPELQAALHAAYSELNDARAALALVTYRRQNAVRDTPPFP